MVISTCTRGMAGVVWQLMICEENNQLFPFKPHVSQVATSYMVTAVYPRQLINTPLEEVYPIVNKNSG